MTDVLLIFPSEWEHINISLHNAQMKPAGWMARFRCWLLNVFYVSCSDAVLAGPEAGPEMEQCSCSHPEHLEEAEGEIQKEDIRELDTFGLCGAHLTKWWLALIAVSVTCSYLAIASLSYLSACMHVFYFDLAFIVPEWFMYFMHCMCFS